MELFGFENRWEVEVRGLRREIWVPGGITAYEAGDAGFTPEHALRSGRTSHGSVSGTVSDFSRRRGKWTLRSLLCVQVRGRWCWRL